MAVNAIRSMAPVNVLQAFLDNFVKFWIQKFQSIKINFSLHKSYDPNLVGCDAGRWGDKCEKRCQERAQFHCFNIGNLFFQNIFSMILLRCI